MARYKFDVYLPDGSAEQFTVDDWQVTALRIGCALELECDGVIIAYFTPGAWVRAISHEFVGPENEA